MICELNFKLGTVERPSMVGAGSGDVTRTRVGCNGGGTNY